MTLLEQIQEKIQEVGIDHMIERLGYKPSRSDKVNSALQILLRATEIDTFLDQGYFIFLFLCILLIYPIPQTKNPTNVGLDVVERLILFQQHHLPCLYKLTSTNLI